MRGDHLDDAVEVAEAKAGLGLARGVEAQRGRSGARHVAERLDPANPLIVDINNDAGVLPLKHSGRLAEPHGTKRTHDIEERGLLGAFDLLVRDEAGVRGWALGTSVGRASREAAEEHRKSEDGADGSGAAPMTTAAAIGDNCQFSVHDGLPVGGRES